MRPLPLLLAVLAVAAGCGGPATDPGLAGAGTELRRGNGGDPGSLDPVLAEDLHAYNVIADLYEGLLTAKADGGIAPGVASSWEVSPDGLTWRFTLRPQAIWSNGERVTAHHFVHGLRAGVNPASRSPNAFLLSPLANADAILRGERPPESLGVFAQGDGQLVLKLERPAGWLPTVLTMAIAMPRLPDVHDVADSYSVPAKFVGNGPYRLAAWRPGGDILLERNPQFHASDTVAIETVRYLPLVDPAAEYNQYRAGDLDVTATVPPSQFESVTVERPCELQSSPGLGLYYLAFDVTEPPLDDPRLREALSLAIDRERLVALLGRGEIAAHGLVPPSVAPDAPSAYDWRTLDRESRERRARAALAGSRSAGSPPHIELTYDAGDVHRQVALAVRAMWQEVLGVDATLRQLEWKAFLDLRADRGSWQVMRFVWVGDYDDASSFTDLFASGGENNLPGYANPRYDGLLRQAANAAEPAVRASRLAEAERTLLADYPIAPLYFMTNKHLVAPRVAGFLPNPLDRHPSRYLRLRDPGAVTARACESAA